MLSSIHQVASRWTRSWSLSSLTSFICRRGHRPRRVAIAFDVPTRSTDRHGRSISFCVRVAPSASRNSRRRTRPADPRGARVRGFAGRHDHREARVVQAIRRFRAPARRCGRHPGNDGERARSRLHRTLGPGARRRDRVEGCPAPLALLRPKRETPRRRNSWTKKPSAPADRSGRATWIGSGVLGREQLRRRSESSVREVAADARLLIAAPGRG